MQTRAHKINVLGLERRVNVRPDVIFHIPHPSRLLRQIIRTYVGCTGGEIERRYIHVLHVYM